MQGVAREAYASPNIHSNFVYIRGAFSTHARGVAREAYASPHSNGGGAKLRWAKPRTFFLGLATLGVAREAYASPRIYTDI